MKKVLSLGLSLIALTSMAQLRERKWNIELTGGYNHELGMTSPTHFLDPYMSRTSNDDGILTYKKEGYSYSNGFQATVGFGYNVSQSFSLNAKLGYKFADTDQLEIYENGGTFIFETGAQMALFAVDARLEANVGGANQSVYAKFGPVLGMSRAFMKFDSNGADIQEEYPWTLGVGAQAAVGYSVRMTTRTNFFVEFGMLGMKMSPDRSYYSLYQIGGRDGLADLTVRESEREYHSEIVGVPVLDDDKPEQALKFNMPYSTFNFNLGLRIFLNS